MDLFVGFFFHHVPEFRHPGQIAPDLAQVAEILDEIPEDSCLGTGLADGLDQGTLHQGVG